MKVEILKPKAYCSGVNNAINMAYRAKKENKDKEIYVLGMLVHNHFVVEDLLNNGVNIVYNIDDIPDGSVVVFTAHGHNVELDEAAKQKNLVVYDAICPKVKKNIDLIKKYLNLDYTIIYIGKEGHPEANACLSLSMKVILYTKNILKNNQFAKDEKIFVINQTTLNILDLKDIHQEILSYFPHAIIADEICSSTRLRQDAIINLNKENVDGVIIIGDQKSSNSKRLYEIAQKIHPEIDSIMVSSLEELPLSFLENKNSLVLSSGASTPDKIIMAIYDFLINY